MPGVVRSKALGFRRPTGQRTVSSLVAADFSASTAYLLSLASGSRYIGTNCPESRFHTSLALAIFCNSPESGGIAGKTSIKTQGKKLFTDLLPSRTDGTPFHLVVVDGADELRSEFARERAELVNALLELSRTSSWIKVFVTSRAEQDISEIFSAAPQKEACYSCNINNDGGTKDDILRYIHHKQLELKLQLSEDEEKRLGEHADGLFIRCTTLFRHIGKDLVPKSAIRRFLDRTMTHPKNAFQALYELYDQIVASAAETDDDKLFLRRVLSLILVVSPNKSLSREAIASFFGAPDGDIHDRVCAIVQRMHAVLKISSESDHSTVRPYHASFYDFVQSRSEHGDNDWPTSGAMNNFVVRSSLRIMGQELKFNICHLTTPMLNKDISELESQVHDHMSEALRYSTRFWHTHLLPKTPSDTCIRDEVAALLASARVLFWIECLSLQGKLHEGVAALERIAETFKVCIFYNQC